MVCRTGTILGYSEINWSKHNQRWPLTEARDQSSPLHPSVVSTPLSKANHSPTTKSYTIDSTFPWLSVLKQMEPVLFFLVSHFSVNHFHSLYAADWPLSASSFLCVQLAHGMGISITNTLSANYLTPFLNSSSCSKNVHHSILFHSFMEQPFSGSVLDFGIIHKRTAKCFCMFRVKHCNNTAWIRERKQFPI